MNRSTAAVLAVAALLVAANAAAQSPRAASAAGDNVEIAKAHYATGEAYYQHGRFADAAREFEEAYRLSGKSPLLYNMGKSYDGGNDFARALDAYQRFVAAAPASNPDLPFATKRVEILQTIIGKIAIDGAVAGSTAMLDGAAAGTTPLEAPLTVNPGRHQLELTHDRYAAFRVGVDVPVGGTATVAAMQVENIKVVTVTAPGAREKDKPLYKKWWLWTAVGGAVVAAGIITAVVVTSSSSDSGLPTVQLPQVR
jgi:tetratricopeptide (TPR) repeat protein